MLRQKLSQDEKSPTNQVRYKDLLKYISEPELNTFIELLKGQDSDLPITPEDFVDKPIKYWKLTKFIHFSHALSYATYFKQEDMLKHLIQIGSDINVQKHNPEAFFDDDTPLINAIKAKDKNSTSNMVNILLEAKADIFVNRRLETPFHHLEKNTQSILGLLNYDRYFEVLPENEKDFIAAR